MSSYTNVIKEILWSTTMGDSYNLWSTTMGDSYNQSYEMVTLHQGLQPENFWGWQYIKQHMSMRVTTTDVLDCNILPVFTIFCQMTASNLPQPMILKYSRCTLQ